MVTAKDVAKYFLTRDTNEDGGITQLKLYKLVYYAQALALVTLGRPLFADKIEARQHGPVPVVLLGEYGKRGKKPIPIPSGYIANEHFSKEELDLLHEVNRAYARYDAWYLSEKTHEEDIYIKLCAKGRNTEYELGEMKRFFSSSSDKDVKKVIKNFNYMRELFQAIEQSKSGNDRPYKA